VSLSIYSELELSMGKNCCIEGCTRGLLDGKFHGFHFPLKSRPDIAAEWIKFVGKENWTPTGNNALCYEHLENTLINRGSRWTLDWKLSPIPTLYPPAVNRLKRKASIVRDSEGGKKRNFCYAFFYKKLSERLGRGQNLPEHAATSENLEGP